MAHDTARVSPRLHQAHENWEASHDFPRFSDVPLDGLVLLIIHFRVNLISVSSRSFSIAYGNRTWTDPKMRNDQ